MVKVARSCGAPKSTPEEFAMIGLVLVTHGRLADEFKAALGHVMGPQKQIEAVTIGAEDDSDLCWSGLIEAVERVSAAVWATKRSETVGGTPTMGLMMLSAAPGPPIVVSAIGPDAQAAID